MASSATSSLFLNASRDGLIWLMIIFCNMISLGKCWPGSLMCFISKHTQILNSHHVFRDDITYAICWGCAVHPCQVHSEGEPSLVGAWAAGAGRARAEQLPAATWLTLSKPEWLVFWMHPLRLKAIVSGQANLFPDTLHAPKSKNKFNSCFTKCVLNTYYDSQLKAS